MYICICLLTLGACAGGLQYLVCVCVCLSVWAISAIPHNKMPKKGHHKNQCPTGKNVSFQSYSYFPYIQYLKSAILKSVSMRKGLRAFNDGSNMCLSAQKQQGTKRYQKCELM